MTRRTFASLVGLVACAVVSCDDREGVRPPLAPGSPPEALLYELPCEGWELQGEQARDVATGLVWDRAVSIEMATHDEAVALCAARGARLPTRDELFSLRRGESADGCQLPACPFRGDRCALVQCGSSIPGQDTHWGVAFSGGALVSVAPDGREALLCVR